MLLRPGNAGSNTAADHLTVLDRALSQIPDRWRSKNVLIRADGAGYSHDLISALSLQGLEFSVGYPATEAVRDAIRLDPKHAWQAANNSDGELREHADVIEITGLLDLSRWRQSCPGMRVIVRRELPHPGATLDAFEIRDGYRYQAFTTNTPRGHLAFLEALHRAYARVEDRIRTGKDTGIGHLPSRLAHINHLWGELALIAADLLALAQTMLLTDQPDLAKAEAKALRYRLLHIAARITRGQRKVFLRLTEHWPWALALSPRRSSAARRCRPSTDTTVGCKQRLSGTRSAAARLDCSCVSRRRLTAPDSVPLHPPTRPSARTGRGGSGSAPGV